MNTIILIISVLLGVMALICGTLTFSIKKGEFGTEERNVLPVVSAFFISFSIGVCFVISKYQTVDNYSNVIIDDELFPIYLILTIAFLIAALVISGAYKKAGIISLLGSTLLGLSIGIGVFNTYWITLLICVVSFSLGYFVARLLGSIRKSM